jgi:caffeoyl-CoA O-methyltransferase
LIDFSFGSGMPIFNQYFNITQAKMNYRQYTAGKTFLTFSLCLLLSFHVFAQQSAEQQKIDKSVSEFLDSRKNEWRYWNVPYQDGKVLFDIIVKNKYTSALEIGTSTGHSTIWLAWAMSKTGGKVITIEIDKSRHKTAMENIKKAGLEAYVDARLADAHELVKTIEGPFDFVFSDADKGWYTQYFIDVNPKLKVGGCFTAHNVINTEGGAKDFLDYIQSLPNYTTTINKASDSGISISYKKSN